ncbi:DNA modification methylase [Mucilaginibacter achroorhodeus]|uniref:site-specific DNA-methyltransferase (cytosine-N(4)-specific) n=1 Tax=Mucilaginibacter achroorhodeus TaxID=2599294 RepID=A0A563U6B5_9SPHI|nr:DNA modification methylase [Mucilaginibacter achroorhodeus]TWR26891.1 DNA modification methylase [Mucilaginibacter achroorhodeus]
MKKNFIQANTVIKVKTADLSLDDVLNKIYTYNDIDAIEELGQSMLQVGQLQPITVDSNLKIRSGGRRFKAALNAGIEYLDVIIVDTDNSNQALIAVFSNQHRTKSLTEKINEAEILLDLIGKNQGQRNDLLKEYDNVLGKGNRFEKAARIIGGISGSTLRKLWEIVQFERLSPAHKKIEFIETMIEKNLSIDRAHSMMIAIKPSLETERIVGKIVSFNKVIAPRLPSFNHANNKEDNVVNISAPNFRPAFITDDVKLYNQSCFDLTNILEDESVNVVFTSPPYSGLRVYNNGENELGLESSVNQYVDALIEHLKEVKRVLKKDGSFFLNIGESYKDGCSQMVPAKVALAIAERLNLKLVNEIVWAKTNSIPISNERKLKPTYEKIFHFVLDTTTYYYNEVRVSTDSEIRIVSGPNDRNTKQTGKKESGYTLSRPYFRLKDFMDAQDVENVIKGHNAAVRQREVTALGGVDHPALMPSYLPILPILLTSRPGDVVLDIFSGSGTTGVCATALDRKYIGIELNPDNFDLSIKQFTSQAICEAA